MVILCYTSSAVFAQTDKTETVPNAASNTNPNPNANTNPNANAVPNITPNTAPNAAPSSLPNAAPTPLPNAVSSPLPSATPTMEPNKPLKDPTQPSNYEAPQGKEEAITHFTLEAVIISGNKKFAIINDKVFKIGDLLGTAKVKSIDTNQVILIDENGEKIILHLFEASKIKEPIK